MSPAPTDHRAVDPPSALADAVASLEADHDCTVVAARDVGSRAWGLSHPGSDYDVTEIGRAHV